MPYRNLADLKGWLLRRETVPAADCISGCFSGCCTSREYILAMNNQAGRRLWLVRHPFHGLAPGADGHDQRPYLVEDDAAPRLLSWMACVPVLQVQIPAIADQRSAGVASSTSSAASRWAPLPRPAFVTRTGVGCSAQTPHRSGSDSPAAAVPAPPGGP